MTGLVQSKLVDGWMVMVLLGPIDGQWQSLSIGLEPVSVELLQQA